MSVAGAAFQDGLGERRQTTGANNQLLDLVVVHESLGTISGVEAALRNRAGELATFQHPSFPRLRGVGRLSKPPSKIVVATDHVSGVRLSDLLAIAERRLIPLEYDGARGLLELRQAGWQTLAQDQSTSIVYGMPKAAKELGAACEVLPLDQIARSIVRALPLRPASGLTSPRKGATHG